MASRIVGITVEIGGDTTKLSKALEGVNKSIKTMQAGLKDVNKLLKLDPSNTEAVTQKQKMLKEAIEATKEKLTTLCPEPKAARTVLPHLPTLMHRSQSCRKTRRRSKKVFPRLSPR